ncbi:MAG: alpha-galactosidase [Clostridia bacterium]|nr:alpha-galactosidase [Clostridia bacterium]
MEFNFTNLTFEILNGQIFLTRIGSFNQVTHRSFIEVQIAGENKISHMGVKMVYSSEGEKLKYISHNETDGKLTVVQESELVRVTTVFTNYGDCDAVRVKTFVENISDAPFVLEEVSSFVLHGIGSTLESEQIDFTRFTQSHHAECQPITDSFAHLGFFPDSPQNQKKLSFLNVGSWSTKEALPQGIIHDKTKNELCMFQIECNNSWYYEIGAVPGCYYLYMGGANATNGGWSKELIPGEVYETVSVSLSFGKTMNEALGEMTKHRRHFAGRCVADESLPTIFNEYMHLSWDGPCEENVKKYAPVVAKTGVEYYVIDCGWHDECSPDIIYHYVGGWRESKARFPHGVKATLDYIKSLGMKPGLWIEPESVGWKSAIIDYYNDDTCFLCRHGRPIVIHNRRFVDFRHPKVIAYLTESIRYMVEDLGAEYIKMDYNQDVAVGTDVDALTPGEGLESAARAYLEWIDSIRSRFPNVLFETCSSGGMRMDYETMSHFSIVSTSDQVNYKKYPYIAGNILSAINPEQAAVWSYPIDSWVNGFVATSEWVNANVSDEQIIMNMINSFLGRMHLASHLELLNAEKFALVKEGVDYYNSIREAKKTALPYMPIGFTNFGKKLVASGLLCEDKLYLAVWNLGGERMVRIPLDGITPKSAKVAYPTCSAIEYKLEGGNLCISFTEDIQARMLEIEL